VTVIGPGPASTGTVAARLVADAEVTAANAGLNSTSLSSGFGWKFVPVIVTVVPGPPPDGVKPVIVGAIEDKLPETVKEPLLVAEPAGAVTEIGPVVAPAGTVATMCELVDELTNAVTPLKVTVFWPDVALKPVP
jgi:hypothetical protein